MHNASSGTTDTVLGLVDENRQAVFIDQTSPAIFRFTHLTVSGNDFTGTFNAFAGANQTFPNGQTTDTGSASGTIAQRASLSGAATVGGSSASSTFNLSYQKSLYELPASFTTVAGSYSFTISTSSGQDTVNFAVASDGSFSGSDSFGCTFSGTFSIPDARYNAYEFSGANTCGGNAYHFTGLAAYQPPAAGSSARLTLEYDNGRDIAVAADAAKR